MSTEQKDLSIKQKADALIAKWRKKSNLVALLTLTTSTGDSLEFKDLEPTDSPKVGDMATLKGEVPPAELLVVDNDKKTKYTFDEKGIVLTIEPQEETTEEDSAEMKALREENESLKEQLTAMETNLESAKTEMVAMITEFEGVARLIGSGKAITAVLPVNRKDGDADGDESKTADLMVALDNLKKKKGRS